MTIMDKFDALIAWESGQLSEEKTIELFQFLLDGGHCWRLQGFYGRMAEQYLQCGLIFERDDKGNFIKPDHPEYRYEEFCDGYPDEDEDEYDDEDDDEYDEYEDDDTYEVKSADLPFEKIVGEGDE